MNKPKIAQPNTKTDFSVILSYIRAGIVVIHPNGNYIYKSHNSDKIYCIPKAQFPNGKREETKLFWDAALSKEWQVTFPSYIVNEDDTIKTV